MSSQARMPDRHDSMNLSPSMGHTNGLSDSSYSSNGYKSTNGTNLTRNGMSHLDVKLERLEECRRSDRERDALVQDLIDRYKSLESQLDEMTVDYQNEKQSRVTWQKAARGLDEEHKMMKSQYEDEFKRMKTQAEGAPFVLALIDGDGAIFHEHLLRAGASGGAEAGALLAHEIRQHVQHRHEGSGHWSIMVQIYANFDGLARKLASIGVIRTPGDFTSFARAFNLSQPLFSLVDVGSGKERADYKIRETFRLFVDNKQCKHIIFGGCHDKGYLPNLNQYQYNADIVAKMTLLETTQAERQYFQLGMPIVNFNSVFREDSLDSIRAIQSSTAQEEFMPMLTGSTGSNGGAPLPSSTMAAPYQPPPIGPPPGMAVLPSVAAPIATTKPTPAAKMNTLAAPSPAPTSTFSYAKASQPPPDSDGFSKVSVVKVRPTAPDPKIILINYSDQRIDPKLPKADSASKAELESRIKQQKVCNNYHILGPKTCTSGSRCTFQHGERMGPKEQLALRHKARERVCPRGSGCRQADCLCGHHCPWGDCTQDMCFFKNLHDLDMTVAMKMDETGKLETVR